MKLSILLCEIRINLNNVEEEEVLSVSENTIMGNPL